MLTADPYAVLDLIALLMKLLGSFDDDLTVDLPLEFFQVLRCFIVKKIGNLRVDAHGNA